MSDLILREFNGKYGVNCYDRTPDLDNAILNFFDRPTVEVPVKVLGVES